jgi:hypothetical protein
LIERLQASRVCAIDNQRLACKVLAQTCLASLRDAFGCTKGEVDACHRVRQA